MSLNSVQIIGNLGRDPEVRRTNNGDPVVNFSVAVTESWRDKATGDRKERTEWFNCVIWNEGLCKVAEQYLKKGSKVFLEGQMQSRKYTDKEGVERQTWELVIQRFGGKLVLLGDSQQRQPGSTTEQSSTQQTSGGRPAPSDEIPFLPEMRL